MEYITLFFDTQKQPDLYDTNADLIDHKRLSKAQKTLKFKLADNAPVRKFMQLVERTFTLNSGFHYTYYIKKDLNYIRDAKVELNSTIDRVNKLGVIKISNNLKVDVTNDNADNDELNELHYIFETQRRSEHANKPEFQNLLWRINNLVHIIESAPNASRESFGPVWQMTSYLDFYERIKLEPDDYHAFEVVEPGYLYIDYLTIGKDLFDCYLTNDVELVKSKGVQQQLEIGYAFFLSMAGGNDREQFNAGFEQWIRENKIKKYLDLSNPIYKPGRAPLAKLVEPKITSAQWLKQWDKPYSFAGFCFS